MNDLDLCLEVVPRPCQLLNISKIVYGLGSKGPSIANDI